MIGMSVLANSCWLPPYGLQSALKNVDNSLEITPKTTASKYVMVKLKMNVLLEG